MKTSARLLLIGMFLAALRLPPAHAHPRLKDSCSQSHDHFTWTAEEGEELDVEATWVRKDVGA